MYLADIQMIKDHPLLGYGYGTHGIVAASYGISSTNGLGAAEHNVIVAIWQGAGLPSLLIFIYVMIYALKGLRRWLKSPTLDQRQWLFGAAVFVALIGILVHGLFRTVLDNPNLGLMLALTSIMFKTPNGQRGAVR